MFYRNCERNACEVLNWIVCLRNSTQGVYQDLDLVDQWQ